MHTVRTVRKGGKSNRSVTERTWEEGEVGKDRRENVKAEDGWEEEKEYK
jgi:hypothetical protein